MRKGKEAPKDHNVKIQTGKQSPHCERHAQCKIREYNRNMQVKEDATW